MIKIIVFLLQVVFVSFVSNIIQFTFVASMTTHSFININADTVRFHITYVVTHMERKQFIDENKLTFMKPLDESLNNQSYRRNDG